MINTRRDSLRKAPISLPLQQHQLQQQQSRYQRSHSQDISLRQHRAFLERQLTDCQEASFPEEPNGNMLFITLSTYSCLQDGASFGLFHSYTGFC